MKKILMLIGLVVVGGGVYFVYNLLGLGNDYEVRDRTMEEVSQHASVDSCYIAIEGRVYDVTSYIASDLHPGKEAILFGCGRDATSMFNERANGSGAHSERARKMLQNYYIGDVK